MNKIKVLNLLRERGELSLSDVSAQTGLSPATATRLVDSLIKNEKLVIETGTLAVAKGRPFKLVKFQYENNYIIGIDLGTTFIRGVLANLKAEFIKEVELQTDIKLGAEGVFKQVNTIIAKLLNTQNIDLSRIHGIGLAVAGLVNKRSNIIEFSPAFSWKNVKVDELVASESKYPVVFDNVTRVMALGELRYGIGLKYQNFICVNVGFGIGGGIIIDGKPFLGSDGMSGEIGHVTVDKNSCRLCSCGNYGCLQALASGEGIAVTAREKLKDGAKSILKNMCNDDLLKLDAKMVSEAANQNDKLALEIFNEAIGYIGIHVSDLIKIFNPQAVVISGGVSFNGDIFFEPIKSIVNERIMKNCSTNVEILASSNRENATIMGALSLVLNEVLNLNFVSSK